MSDEKSGVFKFRFDASTCTVQTSENRSEIIKRLANSLQPYKWKLSLFFLITIIYSVTYVIFPRLLGSILDLFSSSVVSHLLGIGDNSIFKDIIPYAIFALTVFSVNALMSFLQGHIISDVITSYSLSLRSAVIDKFNSISIADVDSSDHKELLSKMTQDIDALNQSLNLIFVRFISSATLFIAVMVMQFTLSIKLGALSTGFCILTVLFTFFNNKREETGAKKQQSEMRNLFDSASEFYSGMTVVQLSGKLENISKELIDLNHCVADDSKKSRGAAVFQNGINELFNSICLVAVATASALAIKAGSATIGNFQCQLIYVRRLFSAFSELTMLPGIMRTLLSSSDRLFDFFDTAENDTGSEALPDSTQNKIEFRNVSFRYNANGNYILENVSFELEEKGITVLSGITGAGKTTIVKLALGFYKPTEGRILYNGEDICNLSKGEYLSKFNVIIQGATLFNDSIYNNIAYGSFGVSEQQVKEAAKLCGADEFIERLPDGYDTIFDISEPNLSEGEIQLVLLSRACLRKKDFVIFDEATSCIDVMTEKKINRVLSELANDCSVIVIAHRNSAALGKRRQISLRNGEIIRTTVI